MKSKKFIIFGSPLIKSGEIREVIDSMKTGWLGTGAKVNRFERLFLGYKKTKYAIAVNSCTAALHLSLLALKLQPQDEVITSSMTFCSTINAIIHAGVKPVLADIDPATMNIDPNDLNKKITNKTRCILPVHFAGRICDMDSILKIAKKHNLKIIEDCAHAIESEYHGVKAGNFGDFGCFSFYSTKNVVTGEGGMVITKERENAKKIKTLALHGLSKDAWKRYNDKGFQHYFVEQAGFKYNMMDIQAAIGIHQLNRVKKNWMKRKKIWDTYQKAFVDLNIVLPQNPSENTKHAYHLYTILINKKKNKISRDSFLRLMHKQKIGTGVHYLSIPEHPYYKKNFGWKPNDFPHAKKVGRETVSLPISAKLSKSDVSYIIATVRKILTRT